MSQNDRILSNFKESNEIYYMDANAFWPVFFYSSQRPSQIGPTIDCDGAAIPALIFFMDKITQTNICFNTLDSFQT